MRTSTWLLLTSLAAACAVPRVDVPVGEGALDPVRLDRTRFHLHRLGLEVLELDQLVTVDRPGQGGDQVLLDGEVVGGTAELDESLLTGESDPVVRGPGDRVLSGTACVGGRAVVRVTAVGSDSYAASLVAQAKARPAEPTPLQEDLARLVGWSAALVQQDPTVPSALILTCRLLADAGRTEAAIEVRFVPRRSFDAHATAKCPKEER